MSFRLSLFACLVVLSIAACSTSPLGRSQLTLFPSDEVDQMGILAFQDLKKSTPAASDQKVNAYVQCVTDNLLRAMDTSGSPWEVVVFDSKDANAFALPGRKIGVYTGMLKVAKTDDQLAAVIGHEIAHVLASHSNERLSTSYAADSGLQLVQAMAGGGGNPNSQKIMALLGIGAQVGVLLPFGRAQESEADLLGLDYMARAGFDPRESVKLWQNMAAAGGGAPPEFLSTHPSHDTRIADLQARMPQAMNLFAQAGSQGRKPNCVRQ